MILNVFFPHHPVIIFLQVEIANFGLYFLIQFSVVMRKFQQRVGILKSIVNTKQMPAAAPNYDF